MSYRWCCLDAHHTVEKELVFMKTGFLERGLSVVLRLDAHLSGLASCPVSSKLSEGQPTQYWPCPHTVRRLRWYGDSYTQGLSRVHTTTYQVHRYLFRQHRHHICSPLPPSCPKTTPPRPHVWLSINMFLFGFVTMMQGVVSNYGGLITCRFFLGCFETGMFPG